MSKANCSETTETPPNCPAASQANDRRLMSVLVAVITILSIANILISGLTVHRLYDRLEITPKQVYLEVQSIKELLKDNK